jgi:hypothetical protein
MPFARSKRAVPAITSIIRVIRGQKSSIAAFFS